MRFLLNEMWTSEIARQLRRRGLDVIAATERPRRYRGVPDDVVFARAQEDERAIVTDNVQDYAHLVAEAAGRGETHYGVVFALRPSFDRARPRVVGDMVRALAAFGELGDSSKVVAGAVFLQRSDA